MKKLIFSISLVALLASCSKVPITGRNQMNLLPESELVSMSLTSYRDFLKEHPPASDTDPNTQQVKRVGERVKSAVVTYMNQHKLGDRIKGYKWEFNLVNDPTPNAWCMPGGKVVVYSGLLPITKDDESLALVLGHEIGHAIARHGNERMSQGLLAQTGAIALDVALQQKSSETRALFSQAYGLGVTVGGILPFSRLQESEADKLGLIFMAMAGYNPQSAPDFWKRMAASSGGGKPPEFLSTHPSDETRIKDIKAYMPTAMKYYKPQGGGK